jgi:hypothetical protein
MTHRVYKNNLENKSTLQKTKPQKTKPQKTKPQKTKKWDKSHSLSVAIPVHKGAIAPLRITTTN